MKTRSIRFKTSVLYSSALCVILACFSIYLFNTIRHILYEETKEDLRVKAGQIEAFLEAYSSISLKDNSPASLMNRFLSANGIINSDKGIIEQMWIKESKSLGLHNDFFRILNPRGQVLLVS
jgi:hypothetical protein